eukprot:TRINITY_DN10528_c0_g1_i1.p1 TRINITY_DN10528_c0_g1~~TRINITY_DN10528_c0_g1_i1.p1  ORF type:complete len:371 (-),score=59.91 TRINITY_DN10528_c0_g1_i1:3-1091(-)
MEKLGPAQYKLLLVGDSGAGKSTLLHRLLHTEELAPRYVPTIGVAQSTLRCPPPSAVEFDVWDTAGNPAFGGMRDGYYIGARCAVLVLNSQSHVALYSGTALEWLAAVERVVGSVPIAVLCLNKAELGESAFTLDEARGSLGGPGRAFFEASLLTSNADQLWQPFLWLADQFSDLPQPPKAIATEVKQEKQEKPRTAIKIMVIGEGEVGKTSFITRHDTGEFITRYIPTVGQVTTRMAFFTNRGLVEFNLCEHGGSGLFGATPDGAYIGSGGAIVMVDLSRPETVCTAKVHIAAVRRVCGNIPVAVVGNKLDTRNPAVEAFAVGVLEHYCELSVQTMENFEAPLLWLAQKATGDDTLSFVES